MRDCPAKGIYLFICVCVYLLFRPISDLFRTLFVLFLGIFLGTFQTFLGLFETFLGWLNIHLFSHILESWHWYMYLPL